MFKDCQGQLKNTLEIVLKNYTKIELSLLSFDILDLKTVGSVQITLDKLPWQLEHDRVTVKVSFLKVSEEVRVGVG